MGIYSTMEITREDCLQEIINNVKSPLEWDDEILAKVLRSGIGSLDNNQLESILFDLIGEESGHNFSIVSDYSSSWPIKYRN